MKDIKNIIIGAVSIILGESILFWIFYPEIFNKGIKRIGLNLPMKWQIVIGIALPLIIFLIIKIAIDTYLKIKGRKKLVETEIKENIVKKKSTNGNRLKYKDLKVSAEIKEAENAIGMEHTGIAEFDNVNVKLKASKVKNATGFKSNSGLSAVTIACDCGNFIKRVYTGQRPDYIECEKCGKRYKLKNK